MNKLRKQKIREIRKVIENCKDSLQKIYMLSLLKGKYSRTTYTEKESKREGTYKGFNLFVYWFKRSHEECRSMHYSQESGHIF